MTELSEKDQGWVDLVKEYTNEFGDVIEVRLITELLIQKDAEHKAEICKLEKENADLKAVLNEVLRIAQYPPMDRSIINVIGKERGYELAQHDKQVKIEALLELIDSIPETGHGGETMTVRHWASRLVNQIKEEK